MSVSLILRRKSKNFSPCELSARTFNVSDFNLFDEFMFIKDIKDLANRALQDYRKQFIYFKRFLEGVRIEKSTELTLTISRAYIACQLNNKKLSRTTTYT